jgi:hypothetical protein
MDVSGLTTQSPDLVGNTTIFDTLSDLSNRHFGKAFAQAFTAANFSTTSGTFQTAQTVNAGILPSGNYLAVFYGGFEKSLLAGELETRFFVNGTTEYSLQDVSLEDDDFRFGHTCLAYMPGLSGATTVTFQIRKRSGGGNVQVNNRTLLFWRVS